MSILAALSDSELVKRTHEAARGGGGVLQELEKGRWEWI